MLTQKLVLPAQSESEIMASLLEKTVEDGRSWIVSREPSDRMGVLVAHALVCPAKCCPTACLEPQRGACDCSKRDQDCEIRASGAGTPDDVIQLHAVSATGNKSLSSSEEGVLWEMVSKVGSGVTESQKEQLFLMFSNYSDVFCLHPNDMGHTTEVKHHIDTGDSPPIHQPPRRIPHKRRLEVKKLLEDMLKKDVIRPSNSPWSSPIILVQKKDGSTRFCIDYRNVNAVTIKDAYPMPRVDDTLDTLGGSKFFSTLDLANGYWQVEVEEKDTQKTAFNTPEGLYELRVMSFGLCNAPATFQHLMEQVLGDMKWTDCLVYIDDIIVVEKTFPDHLHHLGNVLSRLRQADLKLQPAKCKFFQQQVCFLGHVVSPGGVSSDPSKTGVVAEWPIPTNKKEVQQFLGLANYYRRFIKNFASIAKPLQRLTEKNLNFEWTDTCQDAFNHLRKCLVTAPILAFSDFSKFILDTDASDCGIGARFRMMAVSQSSHMPVDL